MISNQTSWTGNVKAYLDLCGVSPLKQHPFKYVVVSCISECRAGDLGTVVYPSDERYHNCDQEQWRFRCVSSGFMAHDVVINGSNCSCDDILSKNCRGRQNGVYLHYP